VHELGAGGWEDNCLSYYPAFVNHTVIRVNSEAEPEPRTLNLKPLFSKNRNRYRNLEKMETETGIEINWNRNLKYFWKNRNVLTGTRTNQPIYEKYSKP
jgi:hypothetical protein